MSEPRHTLALRKPNLRERLHRRLFGMWPDSYVNARLVALAQDEFELRREQLRREQRELFFGGETET